MYGVIFVKVIFLDIDGVMNSMKDGFSFTIETDSHFHLLKKLVDATGAELVLSSTWRIGDADTVEQRLNEFGMHLIGCTPHHGIADVKRGEEIREWIETSPWEIEQFVILDDEADMCEYTDTNLVKTDMRIGLTEADVERAIEILMKKCLTST